MPKLLEICLIENGEYSAGLMSAVTEQTIIQQITHTLVDGSHLRCIKTMQSAWLPTGTVVYSQRDPILTAVVTETVNVESPTRWLELEWSRWTATFR